MDTAFTVVGVLEMLFMLVFIGMGVGLIVDMLWHGRKAALEQYHQQAMRVRETCLELGIMCEENDPPDVVVEKMAAHFRATRDISLCRRLTPKMKPLDPDLGSLMPLSEFVDSCELGHFINYDGFGNYATAKETSDIEVRPTDVARNGKRLASFQAPSWATHVVWYNR